MKLNRHSVSVVVLLVIAGIALQAVPVALGQAASNWVTVFDGTSLSDWTPLGNANWRLADGAVQADKGLGFLVSNGAYIDYQLRVEFWVDAAANSGVFIRCENPQDITAANAYEVNIFDKRPDQSYRTGAIVDVSKPLAQINAGGKWNTYEITAQGSHFTVTLNGTRTVDATDTKHASGWIALQYGAGVNNAGVVKFRKVQIRRL